MTSEKLFALTFSLVVISFSPVLSQDTLKQKLGDYPAEYCKKIDAKMTVFESKASRHVNKYLKKLYAIEKKIYSKLMRIDSLQAKQVFGDFESQYQKAFSMLNGDADRIGPLRFPRYSSYLDTLKNTLGFFSENGVYK